jgi:hypothetical protein
MIDEIVNRRLTVAIIWLMLTTAAVYLFVFEPGKTGFFPPCPFRALTGFTCPGCGSTRAMYQLLHGHFLAAFMLSPLMFLALPFLLYSLLRHTALVLRGQSPRQNVLPAAYIYALFVLVLSFWIFRNTPFYPFPS